MMICYQSLAAIRRGAVRSENVLFHINFNIPTLWCQNDFFAILVAGKIRIALTLSLSQRERGYIKNSHRGRGDILDLLPEKEGTYQICIQRERGHIK
jgi:hypothetical protein